VSSWPTTILTWTLNESNNRVVNYVSLTLNTSSTEGINSKAIEMVFKLGAKIIWIPNKICS